MFDPLVAAYCIHCFLPAYCIHIYKMWSPLVAFGPPAAKSWQRACLITLLPFNDFFSVVFAGKKQPKQVGKMPEIRKKLT